MQFEQPSPDPRHINHPWVEIRDLLQVGAACGSKPAVSFPADRMGKTERFLGFEFPRVFFPPPPTSAPLVLIFSLSAQNPKQQQLLALTDSGCLFTLLPPQITHYSFFLPHASEKPFLSAWASCLSLPEVHLPPPPREMICPQADIPSPAILFKELGLRDY